MTQPKTTKVTPTPVRLEGAENDAMVDIQKVTGLSRSELLRRSFRHLVMEIIRRGGTGWLLEETSLHAFEQARSAAKADETKVPKVHIIATREELDEMFDEYARRAAESSGRYVHKRPSSSDDENSTR